MTIEPIAIAAGPTHYGMHATTVFRKTNESGVLWKTPQGNQFRTDEICTTANQFLKCLVLHAPDGTSNHVPEHLLGVLGLLRASGVCFATGPRGFVYKNNGGEHWRALNGTLPPSSPTARYTVKRTIEPIHEAGRVLRWEPGTEPLTITATVRYPNLQPITIERTIGVGDDSDIAWSRPVGCAIFRPWAWLNGAISQFIWRSDLAPSTLEEVAKHRILDLLGALELIRPPGCDLGGHITTELVGHAGDVQLIEQIRASDLLRPV